MCFGQSGQVVQGQARVIHRSCHSRWGSGHPPVAKSRSARPKQFIDLIGESSLFQQTLERVRDAGAMRPIVITNAEYRFLVAEQAQERGIALGAILLEPVARNTAAAIAAAAQVAVSQDENAVIHVLASDHLIPASANISGPSTMLLRRPATGHLVTFGIAPAHPETATAISPSVSPWPTAP